MRMTDSELRDAYVQSEGTRRTELRKELAQRVRWQIIRSMPNPEGTCGHGKRVFSDQRGAYSSGYVCHQRGGICNGGHGRDVVWDVQPKRLALKALLDSIPPAIR